MRRFNENSRKVAVLIKYVDSVIIQAQKRLKDLQETEKTREKRYHEGARESNSGQALKGNR